MTTVRRLTPVLTIGMLALLALTVLWSPGPYRTLAAPRAQDTPPHVIYLPLVTNGTAQPDLLFTPDTVELDPGTQTSISVRVDTGADLRGATFELPSVQDGVTSSFESTADGATGTLTITASTALQADERAITVQGRSGVDSTTNWIGTLRVKTKVAKDAKTLVADAKNGNDSNNGTDAKPFKTLKKALSVAKSGDTVKLLPGTYGSAGSGDTYPLQVPNGVTVAGTLASTGAKQTFLSTTGGSADDLALTFAGDATVKDVELDVFDTAIQASKGKLTLSNLNLIQNTVNVDLKGTAQAALTKVEVFMADGQIGARVTDQAKLTMDGGKIDGSGGCGIDAVGVQLTDSAKATLSSVNMKDIAGRAVAMNLSSQATISFSDIKRTFPTSCFPRFAVVEVRNSASLVLRGGAIRGGDDSHTSGSNANGIDATTSTPLILDGTAVSDFSGTGIIMRDPGTGAKLVLMDGSDILRNNIGIDASHEPNIRVEITDGVLANTSGSIVASNLKLRRTLVGGGNKGIVITGMNADLGTATDLGGNTIRIGTTASFSTGLITVDNLPSLVVQAIGNTWKPNIQGADSQGHYVSGTQVNSTSSNAHGLNFDLSSGTKIQL